LVATWLPTFLLFPPHNNPWRHPLRLIEFMVLFSSAVFWSQYPALFFHTMASLSRRCPCFNEVLQTPPGKLSSGPPPLELPSFFLPCRSCMVVEDCMLMSFKFFLRFCARGVTDPSLVTGGFFFFPYTSIALPAFFSCANFSFLFPFA